jgi:hypothetical protein
MYLLSCRSFKSAKKTWVRKSQIHKLQLHVFPQKRLGPQIANPHLRKVRKSYKFGPRKLSSFFLICGSPTLRLLKSEQY